jgi:hypothetical protein
MASRQEFAGDFSSQFHQLNGNHFYGSVSISAVDPKDRGNPTSPQSNSRRKFAERSHDEFEKGAEPSPSEDLSWEGWFPDRFILLYAF